MPPSLLGTLIKGERAIRASLNKEPTISESSACKASMQEHITEHMHPGTLMFAASFFYTQLKNKNSNKRARDIVQW